MFYTDGEDAQPVLIPLRGTQLRVGEQDRYDQHRKTTTAAIK